MVETTKINFLSLFLLFLLIGGCIETKPSVPASTETSETIMVTSLATPAVLTDDERFLDLLDKSSEVLISDARGLSKATIDSNNENIQLYGKYLKDDSQKYYYDLNELSISPKLSPALDEYNQSLHIFFSLGVYTESNDAYILNDNGRYLMVDKINVGVAHVNRAVMLSRD